jgi:hypothetical protein
MLAFYLVKGVKIDGAVSQFLLNVERMLLNLAQRCVYFLQKLPYFHPSIQQCYRSGGPGSIPGTTRKNVGGLERGPLGLVSKTEELLDRKVAAPV